VQSLSPKKSFVNDIWFVSQPIVAMSARENIPVEDEVAYDCAALAERLAGCTFGAEDKMRFPYIITVRVTLPALLLALCAVPVRSQSNGSEADSGAIKQACGDFSESFSRHDAHGVAMTFAEDADFTNMRGIHSHGRADIEKWFASLFRGNLKDSQRTDTVRSIRYFSPDLAAVDADTVITGTKAADGSEIPARKGLMVVLMVKQNGRWLIGTFHESEYPAPRGG
jgi:uncharacterized protein (TIGR02246 family)